MAQGEEKRIFHRLLLPTEEKISVVFSLQAYSEEMIQAQVVNLSEGGMGLKFRQRASGILHEGDQLVLKEVIGIEGFNALVGVETQIRWVLHYSLLKGVRAGCQFVNLAEDKRKLIRDYITTRMNSEIRKHDEQF